MDVDPGRVATEVALGWWWRALLLVALYQVGRGAGRLWPGVGGLFRAFSLMFALAVLIAGMALTPMTEGSVPSTRTQRDEALLIWGIAFLAPAIAGTWAGWRSPSASRSPSRPVQP